MEENKDIEPEQPAENIPEVEQSEILPSSEATTPLEENILPEEKANTTNEQSSTINSQLSTEQDMEVHHHTYASHGKKTWKNWLLKCLLYLLVGFISAFIYRQMKN